MSAKAKRLDAQLSAISHAARGVQMIAAQAGRTDEAEDIRIRLEEAKLNFDEAARQTALAMKGVRK